MLARFLMGHQGENGGAWKHDKNGERPKGNATLHELDLTLFKFEISSLNAKTILEFGPGDSTEFFASLGLQVTTVEHHEKWYEAAKERFKGYPNVRVLKGEDEMPFVVSGLNEKFDIAFVDAPQGYFPMRKVHKGYEDCSRLNTCLLALKHAPVVLLHDANRPLERGTLGRLHKLGYKVEFIAVPYGVGRITHGEQNRLDPPRIAEPGGITAGTGPKRRGRPKSKRPDSGDAGGT